MFCTKCGATVSNDACFCATCGWKQGTGPVSPSVRQERTIKEAEQSNLGIKILAFVFLTGLAVVPLEGAAAFLAFVLLVLLFFVFPKANLPWPSKLATAAVFIILISGFQLYYRHKLASEQSEAAAISTRQQEALEVARAKEQEAFNSMTPEEHLRAAQRLLTSDASKETISLGFRHLDAIPESSLEAESADNLKKNFLKDQTRRAEQASTEKLAQARRALDQKNLRLAQQLLAQASQLSPAQSPTKSRISRLQREVDAKVEAQAKEAEYARQPLEVVHRRRAPWSINVVRSLSETG